MLVYTVHINDVDTFVLCNWHGARVDWNAGLARSFNKLKRRLHGPRSSCQPEATLVMITNLFKESTAFQPVAG